MSNKLKDLRNQLKQVVKDLLPELLHDAIYAKLQADTVKRLDQIAREVTQALQQIDARSKDMQSFLMREVMASVKVQPAQQQGGPAVQGDTVQPNQG